MLKYTASQRWTPSSPPDDHLPVQWSNLDAAEPPLSTPQLSTHPPAQRCLAPPPVAGRPPPRAAPPRLPPPQCPPTCGGQGHVVASEDVQELGRPCAEGQPAAWRHGLCCAAEVWYNNQASMQHRPSGRQQHQAVQQRQQHQAVQPAHLISTSMPIRCSTTPASRPSRTAPPEGPSARANTPRCRGGESGCCLVQRNAAPARLLRVQQGGSYAAQHRKSADTLQLTRRAACQKHGRATSCMPSLPWLRLTK